MDMSGAVALPLPLARRGSTSDVPTDRAVAFPWAAAISILILVIWLIPIKNYRLPLNLPFNLELYRLMIIFLVAIWAFGALAGTTRLRAGGRGVTIATLAAGAFLSLVTNLGGISAHGVQTQAVKSLSFFLSYIVAFLLISSTLERLPDVLMVVRAVVTGALLVACAAIYESRTHNNLFTHLQSILPFLVHSGRDSQSLKNLSGGQLRVRASAQHPIALGAVLVMCVPLAVHLAQRASTLWRRRAWAAVAGLICVGALSTVSRTVVLMLLAMGVCVLALRGRAVLRYWPLLLVLFAAAHFVAPGAVSHIYKRFEPKGGLVSQLGSRPGMRGSGRLADLGPGLRYWSASPLFGHGLGTVAATGDSITVASNAPIDGPPIIFDDQYMNSLVSLGVVGFIAMLSLIWGSVVALGRVARRLRTRDGDLLVAFAVCCAGFGAGMATFDAFAFVQCTLIFFIIAALGLRARALVDR